jgi:hypothetical protein
MNAVTAPSVPDPSPVTTATTATRATRATPATPATPAIPDAHEASHTWQLRGVEFDEGVSVSCYECDVCDEVWFA